MILSPVLLAQTSTNQEIPAESVNAIIFVPVQQWIRRLQSYAQGASYEYQNQLQNLNYVSDSAEINARIEKVDLSTKINSEKMDQLSTDRLGVHLKLESAVAKIQNFDLVAKIKKDIGFGTATLTLRMHCDAISIHFKNTNPIEAPIKISNGLFTLEQLLWKTEQTEVQTEMQGCQQIAGFEQLFKEQIQQALEQSFVKEILLNSINSKINQVISDNLNIELNKYMTEYHLGPNQSLIFDKKNDLFISSPDALSKFSTEEIQSLQKSSQISMIIKKQSLESLIKNNLNSYLQYHVFTSTEQKSLHQLTCSRLYQTFLWPSLKSLRKCFEMKIQSRIEQVEIIDLTQLNFKLQVSAWASGEGKNLAYFQAKLDTGLAKNQILLNSFKAQADPEYIRWSGRSKRISVGIVEGSIQKTMSDSLQKLDQNQIIAYLKNNLSFKNLNSTTYFVELKP